MSDDGERPTRRPSVAGLFAFMALLLALMFGPWESTPVDPYAPVQPWPVTLPSVECGE